MKWSRQVIHVTKKDLHESWSLLVLYAALSALATANALRANDGGVGYSISLSILAPLLVVLGMLLVASIVQADSPTRVDAFWMSRPLDAFAVLAAKLALTVVVIIGIPMLGQLSAVLAHDPSAADLRTALAASAWSYWKWLLIALVFAAITKDLKTFIVSLIVAGIVSILSAVLVAQTLMRASTQPGPAETHPMRDWSVMIAGVAGSLALVAYLYRSRDTRAAIWISAVVLLVCTEDTAGPLPARAREAAAEIDADATPHTTFRVGHNDVGMNGVPQFGITLAPDSVPRGERLSLVGGIATVIGRSGASVRAPLLWGRTDLRLHTHGITNVTWLDEPVFGDRAYSAGALSITGDLRRVIDQGIASLRVDGRLSVRVARDVDTLAVRDGSSAVRRGVTTRVSGVEFTDGGESFSVATTVVVVDPENNQPRPFPPDNDVEYALVNEQRHEAVTLGTRGTGSQTGYLVLPGVQVSTTTANLMTQDGRPGGRNRPQLSKEWLHGARLIITHWAPEGSYVVHFENPIP